MTEAHSAAIEAMYQKYAGTFPPELSFVVGPFFRNLDRFFKVSQAEREAMYPLLIREYLILSINPNVKLDPNFIGEFTELLQLSIDDLITKYAPEYKELA